MLLLKRTKNQAHLPDGTYDCSATVKEPVLINEWTPQFKCPLLF